jgi:hypothetical protein
VASGSGEPEGNGVEATRFPFPLPPRTLGEQKAKVNSFLNYPLFVFTFFALPFFFPFRLESHARYLQFFLWYKFVCPIGETLCLE